MAKTKVGQSKGRPRKKKKDADYKPKSHSHSDMEVWATASMFSCQLCQPSLAMEGKEKFSR